ncbi:Alpha/beta hydrolase fold-1, partial [Phellopilus nigrolimitatus]
KELYEPFLDDLKNLQTKSTHSLSIVATEAWAIDCPNHGDSALLNEKKLVSNNNRFTSCFDYAQSWLALMDSGLIQNIESRQIVFVGHSAGCVAAVLTVIEIIKRKRSKQISSLILLECPLLATPIATAEERNKKWKKQMPFYAKQLSAKMDKWPSRKDALEQIRVRMPFNTWDSRAMELFVEHGIRPLPTLFYPDDKTGVTLKCYKHHESIAFSTDSEILIMAKALPDLCKAMPVHLVFAETSFLRPSDEEISLLSARKGDKYASVVFVRDAGHLIVQDAPSMTAKCVVSALNPKQQFKGKSQCRNATRKTLIYICTC